MLAPFGSLFHVQVGSLSRANKCIQAENVVPTSVVALYCEMVGGG